MHHLLVNLINPTYERNHLLLHKKTLDYTEFLQGQRNSNEEELSDDSSTLITVVDQLAEIVLQPSPFIDDLPLIYPLILVSSFLVLSPLSAGLFVGLFLSFYGLTTQILQGETDDTKDFSSAQIFALVASILSTGLIVPITVPNGSPMFEVGVFGATALLFAFFLYSLNNRQTTDDLITSDQKEADLLNEWDRKLKSKYDTKDDNSNF